jgi:hypothetical protein
MRQPEISLAGDRWIVSPTAGWITVVMAPSKGKTRIAAKGGFDTWVDDLAHYSMQVQSTGFK